MAKHTIEVNGIKCYSFHGCLVEEEKIGGHYTVNVSIVTNFEKSFKSDELKDTVDYVSINAIVKSEMDIRSKLIEHVGHRIIKRLKQEIKGIQSSKVKIIKHTPPIGGDVDDVAIIIEE
ncbi:dihydroneopterin aldolase [Brumimicrobium salinarum]|uniref:7,8-dihydroneopterin aldolase n=1 Tax=Brumimicrobium salinarum TaxID=2058658 RepID=A0A2I0R688_9FLAO|nr:dihydroneopterin aldolase [Brumimicrobium salinarum]PKR82098.1 dihydroneopterin aldolase [Brumimicrobium salinarum]